MLKLNRRTLLAATATGLATCALPAFAAAHYPLKHGAFELTIVSDGHLVLPTSFLAPGAPPAEREAVLKAAGQTGEQYSSPTNVTLIRAGSDLILVDMGSGDRFMPTAGKLWDNQNRRYRQGEDHQGRLHPWPSRPSLGDGRRTRRTGDARRHFLRRRRGMGFLEWRQRGTRPGARARGLRHRRASQLRGHQAQGEHGQTGE